VSADFSTTVNRLRSIASGKKPRLASEEWERISSNLEILYDFTYVGGPRFVRKRKEFVKYLAERVSMLFARR